MNFKLWFETELQQQLQQTLQKGKEFKGEPYPEGGEFTELAAAAVGKKPAALISSRWFTQFKKPGNLFDLQVLNKMLLQKGLKSIPDFTYQKIPDSPWVAVGGERAVRELVKLMIMQHEMNASCSKGVAGMNCRKLNQRIGELLGYSQYEIDKFLQMGKELSKERGEPWYEKPSSYLWRRY